MCVSVCALKGVGDRSRWGGRSRKRRGAVFLLDSLISVSPARSAVSLLATDGVNGPQ